MTNLMGRKPSLLRYIHSHSGLQDSLFISIIVCFSVIFYVGDLGFYFDDWAFLSFFHLSEDQSFFWLIHSYFLNSRDDWARPIKGVQHVVLYWLFGLQPLGFHLVKAAVLTSGINLFYWVLRELNQNRLLLEQGLQFAYKRLLNSV